MSAAKLAAVLAHAWIERRPASFRRRPGHFRSNSSAALYTRWDAGKADDLSGLSVNWPVNRMFGRFSPYKPRWRLLNHKFAKHRKTESRRPLDSSQAFT
jgi:hypothetical protein